MKEKDPYSLDDEPTRIEEESEPAPPSGSGAASQPPQRPSQEPLSLSRDIPVELVVVMGRKSVTVQDLMELKAGQIVDWDKVPTDPVDLVAGGKVIGKGELVEVDGKLGVRVLKLLA